MLADSVFLLTLKLRSYYVIQVHTTAVMLINKTVNLFIICLFILPSCMNRDNPHRRESQPETGTDITDLVLIYHGSTHRPDWTADELKPYVYTENESGFHWLFDGFLFIEIFDKIREIEWDPGFGYNTAAKEQWEWLLDRYFASGKGPDALESILDSLADKDIAPLRPRRVVISIPCPVYGFTEWGELNGKDLDFSRSEDQVAAACWFIDRSLEKWNSKKYKHIQLDGFYWVHEAAGKDFKIIPLVKDYLKQKKMKLYWIPYWNAERAGNWDSLGFDCAYQQPNYFFNKDILYQRLNDACGFSRQQGMGMEMEFDNNVAKPLIRQRFYDYIRSFEENGVWAESRVAYYEGGGAWLKMTRSDDPEMKKMVEKLSSIIIDRQKKEDIKYRNRFKNYLK